MAAAEPAEVLEAAPQFRVGPEPRLEGVRLDGLPGSPGTPEGWGNGERGLNGLLGRGDGEGRHGRTGVLREGQGRDDGENRREPNNAE